MFSDEVVCIDASFNNLLKEGQLYPLYQYRSKPSCLCKDAEVDVGIKSTTQKGEIVEIGSLVICDTCNAIFKDDGTHWFRASRFAPIESQDISELTSILSEEPFKV